MERNDLWLTNHDRALLAPGRTIASVSGAGFSAFLKESPDGTRTIHAATDTALWEFPDRGNTWHKVLDGTLRGPNAEDFR